MIKEIGSNFYLSPGFLALGSSEHKISLPDIQSIKGTYLSTCRSGIALILSELQVGRKVALLPAFTCESVLEPFLLHGFEVHPFSVSSNLSIDWSNLLREVNMYKPSVVLIHPYFGFEMYYDAENIIRRLRNMGIFVIEDLTQSMFSSFNLLPADYFVGSIRKWMPMPDGAFVSGIYKSLPEDTILSEVKITAMLHKGYWIHSDLQDNKEKEWFRTELREAENLLNARQCKAYAISQTSLRIYYSTDIEKMKSVRRENYAYLMEHLDTFADLEILFKELPDNVCPFHMSVLVRKKRDMLQQFLAQHHIYATVIWACPKEFENKINDEARYIYDHILCFHIDQRYNTEDMEYIVEVLRKYYN